MRIRLSRFVRLLPGITLLIAALAVFLNPAAAQRLVFSRDGVLYASGEDGESLRRLFALGSGPDILWAVSPDGRRLAWLTRTTAKTAAVAATPATGLAGRPAVVEVADLFSQGRRRKRLFSTDGGLRDRQGQPVTQLGVPPGTSGIGSGMEEWEPVSLAWSADGRTVYLSCAHLAPAPTAESAPAPGAASSASLPLPTARGTYGVDGATGAALVDAEGRWKLIAPVSHIEARGGLLVGAGVGRATLASGENIYAPLVVVNLAEGTRAPLYAAGQTPGSSLPHYAYALSPALAPENRSIAFVSVSQGLWTVDKFGKNYRRLVEGAVQRPRWSLDGKRLLFLLPRPLAAGAKLIYDLYQIDTPKDATTIPGPPRLILQSVDWFDITPD